MGNARTRVLDLGCGPGSDLERHRLSPSDLVVSLDCAYENVAAGAREFPQRMFVQGRGESLPFRDQVFGSVISHLAVPYMNIPAALHEARRVLQPGGTVHFSLHALRFTLHELAVAFPKPKAILFRLWVIFNGVVLHFTGEPLCFNNRYESFQTRRGISLALRHAGFEEISISRPPGLFGRKLLVSARKASFSDQSPRTSA